MKSIIAALLASLLFLAACGDSGRETATPTPPSDTPAATPAAQTPTEEPAQETPTPTEQPPETAEPTEPPGGAGGGGDFTPVPITTPLPSPPPVPADWATYSDPKGRFTFRYPATWFLEDDTTSELKPPGYLTVILTTYEPGTTDPEIARGSIKVDVIVYAPATGWDCRVAPDGASPAVLGSVSGWQRILTFSPSDDALAGRLTRTHIVEAFYDGYCFSLTAYFAQDTPDEETFLQIASSFQFTD